MSNFDPNAILRGAQLTIVGGSQAHRFKIINKAEILFSIPSFTESGTLQVRTLPASGHSSMRGDTDQAGHCRSRRLLWLWYSTASKTDRYLDHCSQGNIMDSLILCQLRGSDLG